MNIDVDNMEVKDSNPTLLRGEKVLDSMQKDVEKPVVLPTPDKKSRMLSDIVNTGHVDLSKFSKKEQEELIHIGDKLNVYDPNTVINYGTELQSAMNDTSKNVLAMSRRSKVGTDTEDILQNMMTQIKDIDLDDIHAPNPIVKFLRTLPIIGNLFNSVEKFMAKYDSLETTVEKCEEKLNAVSLKTKSDNRMLEIQFNNTNEYIKLLEKFIVAGKLKSNDLQVAIEKMTTDDSFDAIQISDMKNFKHDLDLRIINMLTWRTTFIQSLIRIREIQKANMALGNNVSQTIHNMMPMLRQQLTEAVALYNLQQGAKAVDVVQKGFNDILAHNADLTHDAVVAVRKQSESTVVRMETLRHNQERLIATMRDALAITKESQTKWKEQEKELAKMNVELENYVTGTERNVRTTVPNAKEIEAKYAEA